LTYGVISWPETRSLPKAVSYFAVPTDFPDKPVLEMPQLFDIDVI
jgi:hypothetical protein